MYACTVFILGDPGAGVFPEFESLYSRGTPPWDMGRCAHAASLFARNLFHLKTACRVVARSRTQKSIVTGALAWSNLLPARRSVISMVKIHSSRTPVLGVMSLPGLAGQVLAAEQRGRPASDDIAHSMQGAAGHPRG